ncbi:MAG: radical SAM protein [Bacteroidales bacterium]|nr:radical SAM protein [Bacteroidales bacterium]
MTEKAYKYLFGPVNSRRLGISLGVDLAPRKVCSLDCVYCEVGATTMLTMERKEYVKYEKVVGELQHYLTNNPLPDYVTITGSGEPTLNSRFGDVIFFLKSNFPAVKIAVLTNGTTLNNLSVRRELLPADMVMPSLDAVSKDVFEKIDKPESTIDIDEYIEGLISFSKEYKGELNLEILFLKGYNDHESELKLLREIIRKINPTRVQLNTLDRPGVVADLKPLTYNELEEVAKIIDYPNIDIIARKSEINLMSESKVAVSESMILELIKRRPCTFDDIKKVTLESDYGKVGEIVEVLFRKGRIEEVSENGSVFYKFIVGQKKKESKN